MDFQDEIFRHALPSSCHRNSMMSFLLYRTSLRSSPLDSPDLFHLQSPTMYSDEKDSPEELDEKTDHVDGNFNFIVENL